jgi:drug/metabolite transporter (DMT)-like permease
VTPPSSVDNRLAGALTICAAVAIASSLDALTKYLSGAYPVHEVMVVRCVVSLPLFFLMMHYQRSLGAIIPPRMGLVVARGLILASANLTFYLAIAAIPMADAVAIYFTMPFFVAALVSPILGERVRAHRRLAIAAGFLGVMIMIRPGAGVFEPAALLALWSAFGYGTGQAMARPLSGLVPTSVIAFHQNILYLLVAGVLAAIFGTGNFANESHASLGFLTNGWVKPLPGDLWLMVLFGIMSAAAMPLFTSAYKLAEANFIAPFEYTAMFWAVAWGILLFQDFPDRWTWIGAFVVIGAGLFMIHRDRVYRPRGHALPERSFKDISGIG